MQHPAAPQAPTACVTRALALLVAIAASAARADDVGWAFEWVATDDAAAECGDGTRPAGEVERRLDRRIFDGPAETAERTVSVVVLRAPPAWRAVVSLRARHGVLLGVREVSSEQARCAALEDAVVLVVSLMIDPLLPPRTPPPPAWRGALGLAAVGNVGQSTSMPPQVVHKRTCVRGRAPSRPCAPAACRHGGGVVCPLGAQLGSQARLDGAVFFVTAVGASLTSCRGRS